MLVESFELFDKSGGCGLSFQTCSGLDAALETALFNILLVEHVYWDYNEGNTTLLDLSLISFQYKCYPSW